MKAIGIVFLVFAVVMIGITAFGAANEAGGGGAMALVRSVQARFPMYLGRGITWAGLGVCCLGLDALLKKKGEAAASAGDSAAAPAKAPKAAALKGEAPVRQAKPVTEAQAKQVEPQPTAAPAAVNQPKPAPAEPKQVAPPVTPAQPAAPKPAAPPVTPAKPAPPVKPARPAIRPASDDRPKRNEQDTQGQ